MLIKFKEWLFNNNSEYKVNNHGNSDVGGDVISVS